MFWKVKMEEKPVFDIKKVELAIGRCTDVFSELELTLIEVLHVIKSLEGGLRIAIGPEDYEMCEKLYGGLRAFEPPVDVEASDVGDLDADSVGDSDDEGVAHAEGPLVVGDSLGPAAGEALEGLQLVGDESPETA